MEYETATNAELIRREQQEKKIVFFLFKFLKSFIPKWEMCVRCSGESAEGQRKKMIIWAKKNWLRTQWIWCFFMFLWNFLLLRFVAGCSTSDSPYSGNRKRMKVYMLYKCVRNSIELKWNAIASSTAHRLRSISVTSENECNSMPIRRVWITPFA